ncbi:MAG: site-2 protease family protein [Bryobacteraceae bacterium]
MTAEIISLGLIWYVVFLFSTTCHEAAHAFFANKQGDSTALDGGQVTLNPLPHIRREPFGMVLFPIASFLMGGWMMGWASAPYDPAWSTRYPHRAAKMALAGPAANFLLAFIAAIAIHLGLWTGAFHAPASANFTQIVSASRPGLSEAAAQTVSLLFSLNVLLGVFNLLPVPPLDGFSAVALLMNEERAHRFEAIGRGMRNFSYAGLLLSWRVFGGLYDPVFSLALRILYPGAKYS